jgi:Skp family chaperone for outer membrane proteins
MKMIKILFLSLLLLSAIPSATYAAEDFSVKTVAVVDVKRITDESLAAKTAKDQVEKLKNKYVAEIKDEEKKLQARQKELLEQKKALSAEAFNKKVTEFREKVESDQKDAAKKQKIVEAAFMKSLELIRDETVKVVAEIAKEKNLDLVVPTAQLLFSKPGMDISDEVLARLNKRLTKVDVNVK